MTARERHILARQLLTLREAGLPLALCLEILERDSARPVAQRLGAVRGAPAVGELEERALAALRLPHS